MRFSCQTGSAACSATQMHTLISIDLQHTCVVDLVSQKPLHYSEYWDTDTVTPPEPLQKASDILHRVAERAGTIYPYRTSECLSSKFQKQTTRQLHVELTFRDGIHQIITRTRLRFGKFTFTNLINSNFFRRGAPLNSGNRNFTGRCWGRPDMGEGSGAAATASTSASAARIEDNKTLGKR
jgi:hypothetical protein